MVDCVDHALHLSRGV